MNWRGPWWQVPFQHYPPFVHRFPHTLAGVLLRAWGKA